MQAVKLFVILTKSAAFVNPQSVTLPNSKIIRNLYSVPPIRPVTLAGGAENAVVLPAFAAGDKICTTKVSKVVAEMLIIVKYVGYSKTAQFVLGYDGSVNK